MFHFKLQKGVSEDNKRNTLIKYRNGRNNGNLIQQVLVIKI